MPQIYFIVLFFIKKVLVVIKKLEWYWQSKHLFKEYEKLYICPSS